MRRALLLLPVPMVLAGCPSDRGLSSLCGFPQQVFDIEEFSVLQDAQAYTGMHDAIVLDFDPSILPEGAVWRVSSVDILPMIPTNAFPFYLDGQSVSVEVWDADNPLAAPYIASQSFDIDALEWEDVRLSSPDSAVELDQKAAWWTFNFGDQIPAAGMASSQYLVGVVWNSGPEPTLGYSNFNNPCDRNWTDYADGRGFVLNQGVFENNSCSWPMLRVNVEIIERVDECEGESYNID